MCSFPPLFRARSKDRETERDCIFSRSRAAGQTRSPKRPSDLRASFARLSCKTFLRLKFIEQNIQALPYSRDESVLPNGPLSRTIQPIIQGSMMSGESNSLGRRFREGFPAFMEIGSAAIARHSYHYEYADTHIPNAHSAAAASKDATSESRL
jgi:hypothetical protein